MPRKKVTTVEFAAVVWEDAAFDADQKPGTFMVITTGFIVDVDDKQVTLASERFEDDTYRDYHSIPRGMVKRIIRVRDLKIPEFDR